MSFIKKSLIGIFLIGVGLFGLTIFTKDSSGEMAAVLDQLNPLVKESYIYVKTEQPIHVNEYGTSDYKQLASEENGQTRTIRFKGLSELKVDHYLKITNKGAHVITYEEVPKEEVPAKALEQIG